ncbi:heterokaryon incompatibility protein-domain-containing protein [Macrophomina phaseolina]|uniref:Heterokaryon incompatibility protein-domain-containing protein n=1 Tax=Macrophomina phaseolina TaxID=35725 RepID=A0ABQ8GGY4_9PEZI|nr:heterokaryon incompatibility protein-domain-containing protein [Macrophomina phaseolina]
MNFDAANLHWEKLYQDEVTKSEIAPRCDVCNRLKWVLEYPFGASVHLKLGALAAITEETSCSSHPALLRGVRWPSSSSPSQGAGSFDEVHVWRGAGGTSAHLTGTGSQQHQQAAATVISETQLDLLQNRIQFAARTEESPFGDKFGIGDEDWIDSDTFRRWISTCYDEHGGLCKSVEPCSSPVSARPRWFVDTRRRRLVEADPTQSYVALSYVWGAVPQYKTLREDLENLQQDGYLDRVDVAIPRTVRDAIGLVPLLGMRYLWVDSLCILQEDGDELWDQIHGMASIYANASMTIVAAQGEDANFGLRGVKGVSQPRKLPDEIHTLRDGTQVMSYGDGWFSRLMPTKYSYRAWTFQEYLFSRRKIIFKDDSVYWECGVASWEEEIAQVQCPKLAGPESVVRAGAAILHHPRRKRAAPGGFPNLMEYAELVRAFNSKHLTYPEDVPYAFAGVASTMARSFAGGIVCGLPAMFFDVALLWSSQEACMKRRTPAQVQDEAADVLPSWSWMGWEGRIDPAAWKSGNDYLLHAMSGNQTHTVPTVVWFVRASVESDLIRVESTWRRYRTAIEDLGRDDDLPAGWSKHPVPLKDLVRGDYDVIDHPDGRPYAYRHVTGRKSPDGSFAGFDNYAFPIPLVSATPEHELVAPRLFTPLLSGCTERTWFYLGKRGPERSVGDAQAQDWHKIPGPFSVVDDAGVWAGVLQSNFEGICDIEPKGQRIELVALSRGWCWEDAEEDDDDDDCGGRNRSRSASRTGSVDGERRKPIEEWHYEQRPRGGEKYEWYNVLWIERRKGTAYRKSVGRVERSAWERQKRDSTFLKLA